MAGALPSLGTALIGAAGATAAAAYLNAKYHISHDLSSTGMLASGVSAVRYLNQRVKEDKLLMFHIWEEHAKNPEVANSIFLWFEGQTWTYGEFYRKVVGVANWLLKDLGIQRNEIVALYGGNSPEYLMLWFALDAIGAVPSFLNCNLSGGSLMHCVKICDSRYLLCEELLSGNVESSKDELQSLNVSNALGQHDLMISLTGYKIQLIHYGPTFMGPLNDQTPLPTDRQKGWKPEDIKALLYTSGTTGLPKAIIMPAGRELTTSFLVARYLKLKPGDRFYSCMPALHGAFHGLCCLPTIKAGSTLVMGRKFSHQRFWPEIRESKAEIVQYVGELCRYLLNAPPSPLDKEHNVRMVWGNGMRPDVWEPFRERFGIPVVNELYAATDGMGASFSDNQGDFTQHTIGKRGLIWRLLFGRNEKRIKIDVDTEETLRDESGFAIACSDGEPGEVIQKLDPANPVFPTYYKNDAANKRLLRDVFKKGDLWFRSGDMQRMDSDGRVYFVDRLGDTFRWKSENVSTNEVSDILGHWNQIAEANVYGVSVPKADGRCGCAAIVLAEGITEQNVDWKGLAKHMTSSLPRYAVPIFLRITPALDYTGTLKIQKGRLRKEGIELETHTGNDKMYWLPADSHEYRPFTQKDLDALRGGEARL